MLHVAGSTFRDLGAVRWLAEIDDLAARAGLNVSGT
jgi:hypothetical protein